MLQNLCQLPFQEVGESRHVPAIARAWWRICDFQFRTAFPFNDSRLGR
jgi:hypothetical protein